MQTEECHWLGCCEVRCRVAMSGDVAGEGKMGVSNRMDVTNPNPSCATGEAFSGRLGSSFETGWAFGWAS
jgi:hypothetical protein